MTPLFWILSVIIIISLLGGIGGFFWFRQRKNFLALTHYNNGVVCLETGEYPKAVEEFKTALKRQRNFLDARYGLGLTYMKQQRYHEGIEMLKSAVKEMPRNAIAYYNLGQGYINVGNLDEARRVLENAVNINPKIKEIHFNLARVFQEKGNIEQAKKHCQNALKLDSNYTKAKEYLDFLSELRYMRPVNLDTIRRALSNFDQNDVEFMVKL